MRRPDRLLFFHSSQAWGDDTLIEALFMDEDKPILFRARLPCGERTYKADVFSTDEGSAEFFIPDELLDACFCHGCLEPENKEHTDETKALMEQCTESSENNDGV